MLFFFFSSRRRHTRFSRDWSSDVCSSDLVTVPGPPTGVVFNGNAGDFKVDAGTGLLAARFIFATDDGQIAGWNGVGTAAINAVTTPDAVYLGLAIDSSSSAHHLYAANFAGSRIDRSEE